MRRAVAVVVILVLVILIVLGVHSCQVSARNSALRDYANNVSSLVQQSDQTGSQFFQALTGGGASGATGLQNQLNENRVSADAELSHARGIDVPDEVKGAQQNFVLALQMRRDGIGNVATYIQPALGASASKDAIDSIAGEMARIYASDALYTDYAAPMIASALHAAGLAVGGANGVTIAAGQFLPDIRWLTPSFVAAELRVSLPSSGGKPAPGLHGHSLDSVTVAGTTLQTGSNNTIPASPPPTFTLHFTNGGHFTETDVIARVSVTGTSDGGQTVVPQTTPGEHATAEVTLKSAPARGTYTVVATIVPVPGEQNTANNSLSFPVTFQ